MCTRPGPFCADIDKGAEFFQAGDFTFDIQAFGKFAPLQIERLDHGEIDAALLGIHTLDPYFHAFPNFNNIFHPVGGLFLQLRDVDHPGYVQSNIDDGAGQGGFNHFTGILGFSLDFFQARLLCASLSGLRSFP